LKWSCLVSLLRKLAVGILQPVLLTLWSIYLAWFYSSPFLISETSRSLGNLVKFFLLGMMILKRIIFWVKPNWRHLSTSKERISEWSNNISRDLNIFFRARFLGYFWGYNKNSAELTILWFGISDNLSNLAQPRDILYQILVNHCRLSSVLVKCLYRIR